MTGGKKRPQRAKRARERHISIRAIRREPVDVHKLARALITLAQAEMEAQAEHEAKVQPKGGASDA